MRSGWMCALCASRAASARAAWPRLQLQPAVLGAAAARPLPIATSLAAHLALPVPARLKSSASSSRYLARQKSDPFVKARVKPASGANARAGDAGVAYRSRSAYKLMQIDDRFKLLAGSKTGASASSSGRQRPRVVVDLGAAPGGWTQVAAARTGAQALASKGPGDRARTLLFGLDVLPIEHIDGATLVQGDFLDPAVQQELRTQVQRSVHAVGSIEQPGEHDADGFVDVVLSDMMANTTGNAIRDTVLSLDLVMAAYEFARTTLRRGAGSWFVCKVFPSSDSDDFLRSTVRPAFERVAVVKDTVTASRKESREVYWVAHGFKGAD